MVFAGLYSIEDTEYEALRDALEKLRLNDPAFTYEPETSLALGYGFRCGFLGMLHMEIVQERLEREFNLSLIVTAPSVQYRVLTTAGEVLDIDNPSKLPSPDRIEQMEEPYVKSSVFVPTEFMLDHPEFLNLETTRELLRTFEQKERLADLMTELAGSEGVNVTIGEENPVAEMRECTLITSTYTYRDQVIGILGVVGPRRLPYPEVISIVNETARHVTDALSRVRQDLYLPS